MKVQRFDFTEFGEEMAPRAARVGKLFLPTGRKKEEVPPPPPPPTFNEEQLKAAEREAYKKGFLEGQEDGRKQAESEQAAVNRQLLEASEKFALAIAPLFENHRQLAIMLREEMPKVALAIARKVAGPALEQNAQAVIDETVVRCCEAMVAEPKLTITVPEKAGDAMEQKIQEIAPRLPAAMDIMIQRDAGLAQADCRVEWAHGGMERRTEALWQQVEKAVSNMAATAVRDTKEQMEQMRQQLSPANETNETTIRKE